MSDGVTGMICVRRDLSVVVNICEAGGAKRRKSQPRTGNEIR